MMTVDTMVTVTRTAATTTMTAATERHSVAAPALMMAGTVPMTHSTVVMMAPLAMTTVVEEKLECRFDYANESVQYHHHFDGDSCHGCIDHVFAQGKSSPSVRPSYTMPLAMTSAMNECDERVQQTSTTNKNGE